jgi:hypothetical protein
MLWIDIPVILGFAVILSAALTHGLRWRHPVREDAGAAMAFLFIIFFLTMWVVLLWGPAVGPVYFGRSWIGILLAGLFVALLLAAAVPPQQPMRKPPSVAEEEAIEKTVTTAFGCFFWILLLLLIGAIAVRFFGL